MKIREKLQTFMQSIYAGIMIGIGGIVYLSVENKVIGALLFSFGLLTIVMQGFYLYTGKIGFIQKCTEFLDMLIIIVGNYIGTFLVSLGVKFSHMKISSYEMVQNKLNNNLLNVLLLSVFCGMMMYLAIDNYRKSKNIVMIMLPIMIFILSGFEHSVANMFYFHLAGVYDGNAFCCLFVMIVGNGIGANLFRLKSDNEKSKEKQRQDAEQKEKAEENGA